MILKKISNFMLKPFFSFYMFKFEKEKFVFKIRKMIEKMKTQVDRLLLVLIMKRIFTVNFVEIKLFSIF